MLRRVPELGGSDYPVGRVLTLTQGTRSVAGRPVGEGHGGGDVSLCAYDCRPAFQPGSEEGALNSRQLPALLISGIVTLLPAWRLVRWNPPVADVALELQGPRGGLIELRWGDALDASAPLWPGQLLPGKHHLEIATAPGKNPRSAGDGVCLTAISVNGARRGAPVLAGHPGWALAGPKLCTVPGRSEPLSVDLDDATEVALELVKNAASGQVRIVWDDRVEIHDLYAASPSSLTLRFEGVRRWVGRVYRSRPETLRLQLRQGIIEGTLVRLHVSWPRPADWSGDALAERLPSSAGIVVRPTDRGLAFRVTHPEIAVRKPHPWFRSPGGNRVPRFLGLWSLLTAGLAWVGSRRGRRAPLAPLLRSRLGRAALLLGFNLLLLALLLWGLERHLRWRDPFLRELPFDSAYWINSHPYYDYLDVPRDSIVKGLGGTDWYTWGHFVVNNSLGFRDREVAVPKPEDTCRIVVLGDSFTWGQGLAVEERYTNAAERLLRSEFPARGVEIISLAHPGATTAQERDFLKDQGETLQPDRIVVGFVINDPQPMGYLTARERRFYARWGPRFDRLTRLQTRLGLYQVGRVVRQGISKAGGAAGLIPFWEEGVAETYAPDAPEWQAFAGALAEIKAFSDARGLAPPVFAVLNHTIDAPRPTRYDDPDDRLPPHLRQYHQAERLAASDGFVTYNHEAELIAAVTPKELQLHSLDSHPSAKVHAIYGEKLARVLAADIRSGRSCTEDSRAARIGRMWTSEQQRRTE